MNVVLIAFSVPVNDLLVIENEREHIRVLIQTTYPGIALLYTVGTPNADFDKNMLLLKNLQFSPNHYETLTQ